MTDTTGTAGDRLAHALRALHEQAGNPTYDTLVRHGRSHSPAIAFTPQSLSDWRNGRSVPSSEQGFRTLIQILQALARQRDPGFHMQAVAAWDILRATAWHERHSSSGGRPRRDGFAASTREHQEQEDPTEQDDETARRYGGINNSMGIQLGNGNIQNNTFS